MARDKLPAGKKSYALRFILQDAEKTLTDEQAPYLQKRTDIGRTWSKNLVTAAEAVCAARARVIQPRRTRRWRRVELSASSLSLIHI